MQKLGISGTKIDSGKQIINVPETDTYLLTCICRYQYRNNHGQSGEAGLRSKETSYLLTILS